MMRKIARCAGLAVLFVLGGTAAGLAFGALLVGSMYVVGSEWGIVFPIAAALFALAFRIAWISSP